MSSSCKWDPIFMIFHTLQAKNNGIWLIQFPEVTTFETKHFNIDSTLNFSQRMNDTYMYDTLR